jgi:hypothetical protein
VLDELPGARAEFMKLHQAHAERLAKLPRNNRGDYWSRQAKRENT